MDGKEPVYYIMKIGGFFQKGKEQSHKAEELYFVDFSWTHYYRKAIEIATVSQLRRKIIHAGGLPSEGASMFDFRWPVCWGLMNIRFMRSR